MNTEQAFAELLDLVDRCLPQMPDGTPDIEHEQSDVVHDLLALLAEEMTRLHKEKQAEVKGFLIWLEGFIGVAIDSLRNKTKIRAYYDDEIGWAGVLSALKQNRRAMKQAKDIDIRRRQPQEMILADFNASLAKLRPLLERIDLTDKLIDQIVYKLYGLTEDEIAIIEGQARRGSMNLG